MNKERMTLTAVAVITAMISGVVAANASAPMAPEDIFATRYANDAAISPDGRFVAYAVSTARPADAKAGPRYSELHVVSTADGIDRPFLTGEVNVSAPQWSPDGRRIAFRLKRGTDAKTQVWIIAADGGEASPATHAASNVIDFRWFPDGMRVAYISETAPDTREKKLEELGYDFIYFEENLKNRNLYAEFVNDDADSVTLLTGDINVWTFEISNDGKTFALGASPQNLIDERYMSSRIYLLDPSTHSLLLFSDNRGKLGNFAFSPDDRHIAYTAALTEHDHAVSQVFVKGVSGGTEQNLTEPDFGGHVHWCGWKDGTTIVYRANEGVWMTLSLVKAVGGKRQVIFHGRDTGYGISNPSSARGFRHIAFTGDSPTMPADVFYWSGTGRPRRLTELNPWVSERDLGRCEAIAYEARDGYALQGLLYYPVGYTEGTPVPLVVEVHGGPESLYSYGWRTTYSHPLGVLTGRGYAVFLPNYRGSTGYGLAHTKAHYGDPAGVEFDDIADGITHLIGTGVADPDRVGLGGGSYGGYAAAWFATYYTKLVRAAVMFVGISDLTSKQGTTDIPMEELMVHSGAPLEETWEKSLSRSPVYYAHQSRTATLIIGGAADTRVHPSQSMELYRRMKMNEHPAVRLVQYPGEGHGNRKMPGRRDVLYRTIQWYDWYVRDRKPFEGGMPDVDISDQYLPKLPAKNEVKHTPIP